MQGILATLWPEIGPQAGRETAPGGRFGEPIQSPGASGQRRRTLPPPSG